MPHPRFRPNGLRNRPPQKQFEDRTKIQCECGRTLGQLLHEFTLTSGRIVVLSRKPNTAKLIEEDGTTSYHFTCKNHPGHTLLEQRTEEELTELWEMASSTRSAIRLTRR